MGRSRSLSAGDLPAASEINTVDDDSVCAASILSAAESLVTTSTGDASHLDRSLASHASARSGATFSTAETEMLKIRGGRDFLDTDEASVAYSLVRKYSTREGIESKEEEDVGPLAGVSGNGDLVQAALDGINSALADVFRGRDVLDINEEDINPLAGVSGNGDPVQAALDGIDSALANVFRGTGEVTQEELGATRQEVDREELYYEYPPTIIL